MAAERRESSVEMIRILPRKGEGEEEELFDVEKELGRDVKSVFKILDDGGKEKSTNTKFVTAEELERLRKERGGKEKSTHREKIGALKRFETCKFSTRPKRHASSLQFPTTAAAASRQGVVV